MLKGTLIHPDIMAALALCGHGDKVLIADGNYPLDSRSGDAETVYLGLTPGKPTVTDVLAAIQSVVNIEKAEVMDPADGTTPDIFGEFQSMLGGMELGKLGRYEFLRRVLPSTVRLVSHWRQRCCQYPFDGRGGLSRISPVTGQICMQKRQTGFSLYQAARSRRIKKRSSRSWTFR